MIKGITRLIRKSSLDKTVSSTAKRSMGNSTPSGNMEPIVPKNPHFILKNPLAGDFKAKGLEEAVFATGCFWGAETGMWKFPGVYTTAVVYAGGETLNPTYEQVCSGRTGHTEGVYVVWDPKKVSFTDIFRQFLQSHDPSQKNRQGNDVGTQYRGAFYYTNDEQKRVGEAAIKQYEKQLGRTLHTEVRELGQDAKMFYAEDYHQQYLAKPGSRPYCSAMPTGVNLAAAEEWLPDDLKEKYMPKLPEAYWEIHAPSPHCVLRLDKLPIQWPPADKL